MDAEAASLVAAPGTATPSCTVQLHPLVIINISEHFTRVRAQTNDPHTVVYGAVLGVARGRELELLNSFELLTIPASGDAPLTIDPEYLETKAAQFKEVFKDLEILGWYATGAAPHADHVPLHRQIEAVNESPLFVLLNPAAAASPAARELPVSVFESRVELVGEAQQLLFVDTGYTLATEEAERIGVDHVARTSAASAGLSSSEVTAHLVTQHSAVSMLAERIKVLRDYIAAVHRGELPPNHSLLRAINGLCSRLPVMSARTQIADFVQESNDVLLLSYLATLTGASTTANEMLEKFNVVHDRAGVRRSTRSWF